MSVFLLKHFQEEGTSIFSDILTYMFMYLTKFCYIVGYQGPPTGWNWNMQWNAQGWPVQPPAGDNKVHN